MANQSIDLSIAPSLFPQTLYYSQGDVGRVFVITLADYTLSGTETVEIVATKPSGFGFEVDVTSSVVGQVITVTTTATMTDEAGRFPAEIRITDTGVLLGTANFYMQGEPNPHPDGTVDGDADNPLIQNLELIITTATNNWLNDHPEATTTVEDASLTEAKFTNALKLKTIKDYVTPEMFGAKGDGVADDTQELQNALDYSSENNVRLVCNNSYLVRSSLICTNDLEINGIIIFDSEGTGLYIGKSNSNVTNKFLKVRVKSNVSAADTTGIGVLFENVYNSYIQIAFVEGFYKGAVFKGNNGKGVAYNTVMITTIHNFYYGLVLTNDNSGWTNENSFYGGRIYCDSDWMYKNNCEAVLLDSDSESYYNNNNSFYSPSLEGNKVGFDIAYGYYNRAVYPRMEGVDTPLKASNASYGNIIEVGYGNSNANTLGVNLIASQNDLFMEKLQHTIFDSGDLSVDTANSQYFGNAPKLVGLKSNNGALGLDPMLYKCAASSDGLLVNASGLLCVVVNTKDSKLLGLNVDMIGTCRVGFTMFDSNGDVVEESPTRYGTTVELNKTTASTYTPFTYYITGANANPNGNIFKVPDSCVKCAVMLMAVGSSCTVKNIKIKSDKALSCDYYSKDCVSNVVPTSVGYVGQVVRNGQASASAIGWVYYNNAWNAITP